MRIYKRQYSFFLLVNMTDIVWLHFNAKQCLSISLAIEQNNILSYKCIKHHCLRHALLEEATDPTVNSFISLLCSIVFYAVLAIIWRIVLLLLLSGNVHPNPGPFSISWDTSSGSSASILSYLVTTCLYIIMYNI